MGFFDKFSQKTEPNPAPVLTTIQRTETIAGLSVPGIIKNGSYHFTDLQVYRDGLVYCWGMVDLEIFKQKINANWVVPSVPDGSTLSIFGLGSWTLQNGQWQHDRESLYTYIHGLVKQLNPNLENLYNLHGVDWEMRGNVRVAKLHTPQPKAYTVSEEHDVFPKHTTGKRFRIFFRNDDGRLYLTELCLYQNGTVELNGLPERKTYRFIDLKGLVAVQGLRCDIPAGERVYISGMGSFSVSGGEGMDIEQLYAEWDDELRVLQGEPSALQKCQQALEEYQAEPTPERKGNLRITYEAIPDHLKMYIGDMDTKDWEVRHILYGPFNDEDE